MTSIDGPQGRRALAGAAVRGAIAVMRGWAWIGCLAALLACVDGDTAGCTEPARSYYGFLLANVLQPDPAGAPVLLLQGLMDSVMPPAEEAACVADKLKAAGVTPLVCTEVFALHTSIVSAKMELALEWAEAVLAGTTPPGCPDDLDLPDCTP
jgi:hypothetical protein